MLGRKWNHPQNTSKHLINPNYMVKEIVLPAGRAIHIFLDSFKECHNAKLA